MLLQGVEQLHLHSPYPTPSRGTSETASGGPHAPSRARSRRRRSAAGASATLRPSSSAAITRPASAAFIPASSSSSPALARRNEERPRERRRPASTSSRLPRTTRSSSASGSPAAPSLRILSACLTRVWAMQRTCQGRSVERVPIPGSQTDTPVQKRDRSEARAEREERLDLVVGLAQARRQRAHERPEKLVGEILGQEHQLFQSHLLTHVQPTA